MTIIFRFINNKLLAKQHFLVLLQKKLASNYTTIFQNTLQEQNGTTKQNNLLSEMDSRKGYKTDSSETDK